MKKTVIITLFSLITCIFVSVVPSHATDFWLGAGLAKTDYDFVDGDSPFGFEATAEVRFNKYFGAGLSYINMGEESYSYNGGTGKETESVSGLSVSALGFVPITDTVNLFGKIGMIKWDGKYKDTSSGMVFANVSDDGFDAYFGGGLSVELADRFAIRAEYDYFSFSIGSKDEKASRYMAVLLFKL